MSVFCFRRLAAVGVLWLQVAWVFAQFGVGDPRLDVPGVECVGMIGRRRVVDGLSASPTWLELLCLEVVGVGPLSAGTTVAPGGCRQSGDTSARQAYARGMAKLSLGERLGGAQTSDAVRERANATRQVEGLNQNEQMIALLTQINERLGYLCDLAYKQATPE